ncbi:CaiB/BaiF CoA transferase family protein [Streptomyces mutabilis]|uniref:CaiB/BaiF CoA transferase family protein n=1 Tax=Streptomyces mutabilis TaxID=67332 RepID=UPI00177D21E8|nr:CaiB/BaiF CoA-transferase family protein [Streptomyces mutabilis]GGQ35733.1 succinyl-CoA--L-malate CoA-transferase alpha subunit [Streptomyces mutabilis]
MSNLLFNGPRGPLAGLRVLEAANVYAGPFAASLLGDFGAEVLKIEMPGAGDPLRAMHPFDGDEPLTWTSIARNKKSMTLDLRVEEGREIFLELVASHDVLIENFRPGTLDRWKLTAEDLRAANPDLVITRVSGFGQTGPNSPMAGFGTPATAFTGYVYGTGFPDREPVLPPISLVDYVAGLFAAFGTLVAVRHRDVAGGPAQEVDVALYESLLRFLEGMVTQYDRLGTLTERQGNQFPASVPCGLFRGSDDVWMVLSTSSDRTFNRLAELMGRSDMLTDPRYCTNRARVENRDAVNAVVEQWFGERTGDEIQRLCDAASVPVSRVNSMADVFTNPHVRERGSLVEVAHPNLGTVTMPGVVPRLTSTPGAITSPGPRLGEHTDAVLGMLGRDNAQIRALREQGVI